MPAGCRISQPSTTDSGVPPTATSRTTAPPPEDVVACPLQLGGATIHLPKTLHYASPNRSDERRLAWVVHFGVRAFPPTLL